MTCDVAMLLNSCITLNDAHFQLTFQFKLTKKFDNPKNILELTPSKK
jgi:hypothetical protein